MAHSTYTNYIYISFRNAIHKNGETVFYQLKIKILIQF